MPDQKSLAIVLIDGFADWEYPLLAASARHWFGITTRFFTPGGDAVTSIGGLRFADGHPLKQLAQTSPDAIAVIGSDNWTAVNPPDIIGQIQALNQSDKVIGGICAGTVPLARAGLFGAHRHTSNGRAWFTENAGDYTGTDFYEDRPFAIRDNHIISAPGSAPGTFAIQMLSAMLPDHGEQLQQMHTMFAREYDPGARA